ncbi:MAG: twin-arginine translocation signal domain-containing protein, partial [Acidobacteriota bacterium]
MNRRDFLKSTGAAGTALTAWPRTVEAQRAVGTAKAPTPGDREVWLEVLTKVAEPVLTHLAAGTLRARMPVEQAAGSKRQTV